MNFDINGKSVPLSDNTLFVQGEKSGKTGWARALSNQKQLDAKYDRITNTIFGPHNQNTGVGGTKKWISFGLAADFYSGKDTDSVQSYLMWREDLKKAGWQLGDVKQTSMGLEADILPIKNKAVMDPVEFRKRLGGNSSSNANNIPKTPPPKANNDVSNKNNIAQEKNIKDAKDAHVNKKPDTKVKLDEIDKNTVNKTAKNSKPKTDIDATPKKLAGKKINGVGALAIGLAVIGTISVLKDNDNKSSSKPSSKPTKKEEKVSPNTTSYNYTGYSTIDSPYAMQMAKDISSYRYGKNMTGFI